MDGLDDVVFAWIKKEGRIGYKRILSPKQNPKKEIGDWY
jgi:hypothetical protein